MSDILDTRVLMTPKVPSVNPVPKFAPVSVPGDTRELMDPARDNRVVPLDAAPDVKLRAQKQYNDVQALYKIADVQAALDPKSGEKERQKIGISLFLSTQLNMNAKDIYRSFAGDYSPIAADYFKSLEIPYSYLDRAKVIWQNTLIQAQVNILASKMYVGGWNEDTNKEIVKLLKSAPDVPERDKGLGGWLKDAPLEIIRQGYSLLTMGGASAAGGAIGGTIGSVFGPGGRAVGSVAGRMIGTMISATAVEAADIYQQILYQKVPDPETGEMKFAYELANDHAAFAKIAASSAAIPALLIGAANTLGWESVLGKVPFPKFISKVLENGALKTLYATRVGKFIATYGKNITTEMLTESFESVMEQKGVDAAVRKANKEFGSRIPESDINTYVELIQQTMDSVAKLSVFLALPGSIGETARALQADLVQNGMTPEIQERIDALAKISTPAVIEPKADLYRTSEGDLYSVQRETRTEADGSKRVQLKYGDPSIVGDNRYGHAVIIEKAGQVFIEEVVSEKDYNVESQIIKQIAADHVGQEIVWEPQTEGDAEIKAALINQNPRGKEFGLQHYGATVTLDRFVEEEAAKFRLGGSTKTLFTTLTVQLAKGAGEITDTFLTRRIDARIAVRETAEEFTAAQAARLGIPVEKLVAQAGPGGVASLRGAATYTDSAGKEISAMETTRPEYARNIKGLAHAFENADFSTAVHELFHIIERYGLTDQQTKMFEIALGKPRAQWGRGQVETLASGMETYLATGQVADPALRTVFEQIADIMRSIFEKLKINLEENKALPEAAKKAYRSMLAEMDYGPEVAQKVREAAPEQQQAILDKAEEAASIGVPETVGEEFINYQVRPPYSGQKLTVWENNLSDEATVTYKLLNDVVALGKVGKGNIFSKYKQVGEWNDLIEKNEKARAAAVAAYKIIPAEIRKQMHLRSDGTIKGGDLETELKMQRSFTQRLIDALPLENVSSTLEIYGKSISLSDASSMQAVGGESYRRALVEEYRKQYRMGTIKQVNPAGLRTDTWGALGFIATNEKTGISGDFTTMCPQMFYNRGCWYCYRLAALKSGLNNKLVGQKVWYAGELLRLSKKNVVELNAKGGLRIQSFGDWMDHFSGQFADMLVDADTIGLQVKVITKEPSLVEFAGRLKAQGIGKKLYFNLSADYNLERAGKIGASDEYQPLNPNRPFEIIDGEAWWKRALSVEEAAAYRSRFPWMNVRIVATDTDEFIRGLKDARVDVVTGYHGRERSFERIDVETGETKVEVEPLGDAGMPRFLPSGEIDPAFPGKTKKHKKLAKAIYEEGLQKEYLKKTCCITGRCASCKGICGLENRKDSLQLKNATNRDLENVVANVREAIVQDADGLLPKEGWEAPLNPDDIVINFQGDALGNVENEAWLSKAEVVVGKKMNQPMPGSMIKSLLLNEGVKSDEMLWTGLTTYLEENAGKKISSAEMLSFIDSNRVLVKEIVKGSTSPYNYNGNEWQAAINRSEAAGDFAEAERINRAWEGVNEETGSTIGEPKFSTYQLPGATNYREILFTLPVAPASKNLNPREARAVMGTQPEYHSPHWDEPNVVLHLRVNDRVDALGRKMKFMEEDQSDWHQKGRESGYADLSEEARTHYQVEWVTGKQAGQPASMGLFRTREEAEVHRGGLPDNYRQGTEVKKVVLSPSQMEREYEDKLGVPPAPLSKSWHELGFRKVLRLAAKGGFEAIGWTTGEQQNVRYDLSQQVDNIRVANVGDKYHLRAITNGESHEVGEYTADQLPAVIGKELSENIVSDFASMDAAEEHLRVYSGDDLKVEGKGMKGFYDKILVDYANKLGKRFGVKVEDANIGEVEAPAPTAQAHLIRQSEFVKGENVYNVELTFPDGSKEWRKKYTAKTADEAVKGAMKGFLFNAPKAVIVHSLAITPAMREAAGKGEFSMLFQATPKEMSAFNKTAEKAYGTTEDPAYGAWILSNGKMLDFRTKEPDFFGKIGDVRLNHSDISRLFKGTSAENMDAYDGAWHMGAVRNDFYSGSTSIQSVTMPNKSQMEQIRKWIKNTKKVAVELMPAKMGERPRFLQIVNPTPEKVQDFYEASEMYTVQGDFGFDEWVEMAKSYKTAAEFKAAMDKQYGENFVEEAETTAVPDDPNWYKKIWDEAHKEEKLTAEEAKKYEIADPVIENEPEYDYAEKFEAAKKIDDPEIAQRAASGDLNTDQVEVIEAKATADEEAGKAQLAFLEAEAEDLLNEMEPKLRRQVVIEERAAASRVAAYEAGKKLGVAEQKAIDEVKYGRQADKQKARAAQESINREKEVASVEVRRQYWEDKTAQAYQSKRDAIAKLRKDISTAQALREFAKQTKEGRKKLLKDIMRAPSAAIEFEGYAEEINRLQSGIDPNNRSAHTLYERQRTRDFLATHADAAALISEEKLALIYAVPANALSVAQLEELSVMVDTLRKLGRLKRSLKLAQDRNVIEQARAEGLQTALRGNSLRNIVGPARPTNLIEKGFLMTWKAPVIAKWLDGGKDGFFTHWLVDEVNEKWNLVQKAKRKRTEAIFKKMEELKITANPLDVRIKTEGFTYLGRKLDIDGFKYEDGKSPTVQKAMFWYIGTRNELTNRALRFGVHYEEGFMAKGIAMLTPQEIELADAIGEDFSENFPRLREAFINVFNVDLKHEAFYVPMVRVGADYQNRNEAIAADLAGRQGVSKTFKARNPTYERLDISEAHQTGIKDDLFSVWQDAVETQEGFIVEDKLIKQLHTIMETGAVKQALLQQHGSEMNAWMGKYINAIARTDQYAAMTGAERFARKVRGNMAVAWLGFNVLSNAKQLTSAFGFLGDAGPLHLANAALKFAAGQGKSIASGKFFGNSMIEENWEMSELLRNRSISQEFEDLKRMNSTLYEQVISKLGKISMASLEVIDRVSVNIGWRAVFDRVMAKNGGDKIAAATAADKALVRCQPSGRAQDMAELYRSGDTMKMFTMFTSELSAIWNRLSFGLVNLPNSLKNGQWTVFLGDLISISMSGVAIAAMSGALHGDDPDKKKKQMFNGLWSQFADSIPLAGSDISSALQGKWRGGGVKLLPMLDYFMQIPADVKAGDLEKAFTDTLKGVGFTVGAPVTAVDRFVQTLQTGDVGRLLNWPEEKK